MRASVIVVSYNSRADLQPCLDSILPQLASDDELIVVDNGSTDGSAGLVRAAYPQVRLLCGANTGYAGGNNRGAQAARGDYLVFLNPDTVLQPGAISALIAPLAAETSIALTTACVVMRDRPTVVNTCGHVMHYTGLTYCRGAGQAAAAFRAPVDVAGVSGAACAIRRAVFVELGGFDERFFMYVEDADLSWRARLAGYRCRYVPSAVVAHAYTLSYTPAKAFYLDRNRHMMLLKNVSARMYGRMVPGLLLAEIVTGGFMLLKGPRYWAVKLRVYRSLWAQRAAIQRARREVQRRRRASDREVLRSMTHELEFAQLASRSVARLAARVFHPAFWAARRLLV